MAALTPVELKKLTAFERSWDPLLGGTSTRVYREFLGFALARIAQLGANPDDVLRYVAACFEIWNGADPMPPDEVEGGQA